MQNAMETHTRKPMLLLKLSGSFLLRYAHRALRSLLFHEPPRKARVSAARPHPHPQPPSPDQKHVRRGAAEGKRLHHHCFLPAAQ